MRRGVGGGEGGGWSSVGVVGADLSATTPSVGALTSSKRLTREALRPETGRPAARSFSLSSGSLRSSRVSRWVEQRRREVRGSIDRRNASRVAVGECMKARMRNEQR